MLRLSVTPDLHLPSMRDIDVKNQPTMTEKSEKSTGSEIRYTETQINGRTWCHGRLIQPRTDIKTRISDVIGGKDARGR